MQQADKLFFFFLEASFEVPLDSSPSFFKAASPVASVFPECDGTSPVDATTGILLIGGGVGGL